MTVEQKTFIEPKDILAIELECKLCHSRVLYPAAQMDADRFRSREHHCPNCPDGILAEGPEANRLAEFVDLLQRVIKNSKAGLRLQVRNLETKDEK